jgi:DivIVA domain-containing protein
MPPSSEGETRSAFVVQRAFRHVRKGYDPAEVDRHLQLVSEWFRASRTAERAREVEQQLLARERAVADSEAQAHRQLESSRVEADATLEGARLRAEAEREATERHLHHAPKCEQQVLSIEQYTLPPWDVVHPCAADHNSRESVSLVALSDRRQTRLGGASAGCRLRATGAKAPVARSASRGARDSGRTRRSSEIS